MPVMPKELRDYQVEDVELLLSHKRFALWHEPGVGKTLPAMHAASHHKPILIACPGYIVPQWAEEIAEAFPHDTIVQCVGPTEARQVAALIPADWTIANLEMLRTPDTFVRPYQTLILDEVHHYRGRTSQQSKGAQTLADRIPNVYQLTGTPIENEADDLFKPLQILDPYKFLSYQRFLDAYCKVTTNGFTNKVKGIRHERELRALLNNYRIRRTYKSTGLRRPTPIERTIQVTPSALWLATYHTLRKNYRLLDVTFSNAPSLLMALRALTFKQKIATAKAISEDHPNTLFFVYYRESATILSNELGIPAITGALAPTKRKATARAAHSAVVTISSMSEGVDLTHFDTVAFIEDDYLPGKRTQAVDRVVRWSQDNTGRTVFVFNVRVKGTIDERISGISSRRSNDMVAILREEIGLPPITHFASGLVDTIKLDVSGS